VFNNEIEKEGLPKRQDICRMQKPNVDIAITTDLVEAFLKCPTKCFLLARAEVATGNAYADWVRTKSEIFRSEGITRLVGGGCARQVRHRHSSHRERQVGAMAVGSRFHCWA
jgi:hypothetical protein